VYKGVLSIFTSFESGKQQERCKKGVFHEMTRPKYITLNFAVAYCHRRRRNSVEVCVQ